MRVGEKKKHIWANWLTPTGNPLEEKNLRKKKEEKKPQTIPTPFPPPRGQHSYDFPRPPASRGRPSSPSHALFGPAAGEGKSIESLRPPLLASSRPSEEDGRVKEEEGKKLRKTKRKKNLQCED